MDPLRRNRDFVLLQAGQLLSSLGSASTAVVYPLLVLAITHSPAKAGLVSFARFAATALLALPAGLRADRHDRRRLMIAADVIRAAAVAALAVAIAADELAFWQLLAVATIEGGAYAVFSPAAAGALKSVVPPDQLADAAGIHQTRSATVAIAGPPLGGALLQLGRAVPFVVDAVSYVFSTLSLLAMRTRFQQERESHARPRLAEGARFLWNDAFLRTAAFLYGLTNVIGPGLTLALVVIGTRQGLSSAAVGILVATFGAGVFAGSLLSPLARRTLSVRAILLLEFWAWTVPALFLIRPDVYLLAAALLPPALAIPITDSVVIGYRLKITPDRLLGRVESVRSTIALLLAPLGPLLAGLLLGHTSERAAVAVFAALGLLLALLGTASRAIRDVPALRR